MTDLNTAPYDAESVLEAIREPLIVLSPELRVVTVNPAFLRVFGATPVSVIGRLIYEVHDREWDMTSRKKG
ncbi:hypothetical protein AYO47_00330 [Planctomyces sp. SCGC AG-212-M04]|nr:hypothetical protein AYO47_00330 [Planctomyces sp. SCGC AG-212-M04]